MSNKNIFLQKLIYTVGIVLVYMLGRSIPLYGIDLSAYQEISLDASVMLQQAIGGDTYQHSILALGIAPYMISSLLVQIIGSLTKSKDKGVTSPITQNRQVICLTLVIGAIQAYQKTSSLSYGCDESLLQLAIVVSVAEMLIGALVILWLAHRNKKFGIGGQTALIFVNLLDGLVSQLQGNETKSLLVLAPVCLLAMVVTLFMENGERHIFMQRVAVHTIYEDRNYIAIKFNPIGVMPVMFATAVLMLPQMAVAGLLTLWPTSQGLLAVQGALVVTTIPGMIIYICIFYLLNIALSLIFLDPKSLTEQLLQSGDSIVGLRAGKETKKYLTYSILFHAITSSTVLAACIAVPMSLYHLGVLPESLMMLVATFMMLTGIWSSLYWECLSVRSFEEYKPFL